MGWGREGKGGRNIGVEAQYAVETWLYCLHSTIQQMAIFWNATDGDFVCTYWDGQQFKLHLSYQIQQPYFNPIVGGGGHSDGDISQ